MVKVSVEVRSGSARFRVSVRAQSIRQAANIVSGWYPDGEIQVEFPIDPGGFFVEDPAIGTGNR